MLRGMVAEGDLLMALSAQEKPTFDQYLARNVKRYFIERVTS
jgi:hypothetical protein